MANIIQTVEADVASVLAKVNVPALITAAQSLVAAWQAEGPTIAAQAAQLPGLVAAIEKALSGGTPTDADWAAVDATLDANDATIENQGAAAQAQIDAGN